MDYVRKVIPLLAPAARLVLGLTFVAAALLKLRDPAAFADAIARYHLVSGLWPSLLAVFLPALELLAGTAVLVRRTYLGGLTVLGAASLVFTGALGSAWWRGLDLVCGCFGPGRTAQGDIPFAFARALVLAALAFGLLWHERRRAHA
jgi:hypothetical protein